MDKPIIIISTGRSGSTVFADMLSYHKDLVFISQITSKVPKMLWLSRLFLRLSKIPAIGKVIKRLIKISEGYPFWDTLSPVFSNPEYNLTEVDLVESDRVNIINKLNKLRINKNSRLLIKITGWPRIGYLLKIFPDAYFVNIIRDGRAVAYSLMNVDFWSGNLNSDKWRIGPLSIDEKELYEKHGRTEVALAGIYWNKLVEAFENDIKQNNPKIFTVKYEDFCKNRDDIMVNVIKFCELREKSEFNRVVHKYLLSDNNKKWERNLSISDQEILNDVTKKLRNKLGY